MSSPKFEKQYNEMIEKNKELFDELKLRSTNPKSEDFKEVQRKALRIVRRSEDTLCSKTENTHFSSFSSGLADKFWEMVRSNYPEIDYPTD
ncbi:MAG: hypothetical protein WC243_03005 [Patescibacteria group bacterium]|jgi:hypothetical protein